MKKIKSGDEISWVNVFHGQQSERHGPVVEVVKKGALPTTKITSSSRAPQTPRDVVSYVVRHNGKTYWPAPESIIVAGKAEEKSKAEDMSTATSMEGFDFNQLSIETLRSAVIHMAAAHLTNAETYARDSGIGALFDHLPHEKGLQVLAGMKPAISAKETFVKINEVAAACCA